MGFKKVDESFICVNCGKEVKPLGYTSRNHCPYCLHSLHVDITPGDRANPCKGILKPIGIGNSNKKGYIINFKCEKCGATFPFFDSEAEAAEAWNRRVDNG